MNRLLLVLILCLSVFTGKAQDYTFKVLIAKGQSSVRNSDASWHDVRIGESLNKSDELKVAENAYLGLVHVSGKPYEVKLPGDYSVADLSSKVGSGASVLNKYTDFILSSDQEKKNRLTATGAVHRGENAPIDLYLPPAGIDQVYESTITISWEVNDRMAPYEVVFSNLYGDELFRKSTQSPSLKVNIDSGALAKTETILVTVNSMTRGKSSTTKSIKKLPADVMGQVHTMVTEFGQAVDGQTPLNVFVMAGFYEERGLIVDALSCYYRASVKAPDVEAYKAAYDAFLHRLELK